MASASLLKRVGKLPLSFPGRLDVDAASPSKVYLSRCCLCQHQIRASSLPERNLFASSEPKAGSEKATVFQGGNFIRRSFRQRKIARRALPDEGNTSLEEVRSMLEQQLEKTEVEDEPAGQKVPERPKFDKWPQLLLILFALGAISGPLLDGIHSHNGLQIYDTGAIEIGSGRLALKTDLWVVPLLGTFYAVVGALYPFLDDLFTPSAPKDPNADKKGYEILLATWGPTAEKESKKMAPWEEVVPPFQFILLSFLLAGSAYLFKNDVSYDTIWIVLAGFSFGSWATLDATWWGFAIAAACAVVAPASELVLNSIFHLWHYPKPDVTIGGEGMVSWVSMCYFFYCPPLGNLGRSLRAQLQGRKQEPVERKGP